MSVLLRVEGRGGHASTPARMGPTARLARAITRLDRSPMPTQPARRRPSSCSGGSRRTPRSPCGRCMANAARLGPALAKAAHRARPESAAAMVRTTFAVTTLQGSPALNVIAQTATAGVNIRIMLGDTSETVLAHLRKVIGDDRVEIDVVEVYEPSPLSPYSTAEQQGRRLRADRGDDRRGLPRRRPRALRDDGRHRLAQLRTRSATGSTGSRRSG